MTGRTGEITKDKLTLFSHIDNEKLSLRRDQIVYVYRVKHQSGKTGQGVASGANKGRKVGEVIGTGSEGKIFASGVGAVVGGGIGAVFGAAKKKEKLRVLIYSK